MTGERPTDRRRTQQKTQQTPEPERKDFPGLENDPDCLRPVYESWERWLKAKQNPPEPNQENNK
jgi:hypothetical protein